MSHEIADAIWSLAAIITAAAAMMSARRASRHAKKALEDSVLNMDAQERSRFLALNHHWIRQMVGRDKKSPLWSLLRASFSPSASISSRFIAVSPNAQVKRRA